ncbi:MAG: hypothetical protein J6L85_07120 [Clostridia bacterium]|nr:hypothetical protein [Clostridia bacterium]
MDWKKIYKALLFPHIAIMIVLIPIATALLVCSMVFLGTESVIAIISYVIAAYTLTVWCFGIPNIIKFVKTFKNENKYARIWLGDRQLRVKSTLYASLLWNAAYAVFQFWLGVYHSSFWFHSLGVYYISLAVMRLFLARYISKNTPGEKMRAELVRYRACGWVFLFMNLALSLMIFFMVYWNRTFVHHEITTIALAAYTFTSFTTAIINIVKYRKFNSPVYSASKAISFAAACVSMLTLEAAMLTTFGANEELGFRRLMLGLTGGAISAVVIIMALAMIKQASKKLKLLKETRELPDEQ